MGSGSRAGAGVEGRRRADGSETESAGGGWAGGYGCGLVMVDVVLSCLQAGEAEDRTNVGSGHVLDGEPGVIVPVMGVDVKN